MGFRRHAMDGKRLISRSERIRHLASVIRSLSVDGADLAGLMVAVRELRALAE